MFAGVLRGSGLGGIDPEEERDPPPQTTKVEIPQETHVEQSFWNDDSPPPALDELFSKIVRPVDLSDAHIATLNISILPSCSISDLVPLAADGTSYLPSAEPEPTPDKASYSDAVKSDADEFRKRKDLDERLAELAMDNDSVFRTINKTTKGPDRPPRLAYMRKFFEGLENMSRYWDCSLDCYYDSAPQDCRQHSPKRQRLDNDPHGHDSMIDTTGTGLPAFVLATDDRVHGKSLDEAAPKEPIARSEFRTKAEIRRIVDDFLRSIEGSTIQPVPKYKGRRNSTGYLMPDNIRSDTVQGFVEGVAWPFQSTLSTPRTMPRVCFNKLNLPIRQSAGVYRVPLERSKARKGWVEGPVLGIQTRPEVNFNQTSPKAESNARRLDLLRELGALLQLAQDRHKEGKEEVKPGEGKWWTSKVRWGGGTGVQVYQDEDENIDVLQAAEELSEPTTDRVGSKDRELRSPKMPTSMRKILRYGKSQWDPKTEYKAIGKQPGSPYDKVFLVSSLFHHVAILKLTVHSAYLDYLESSTLPSPLPEDREWCRPKMERSRWYDLFEKDDRLELFRGLWGIMTYLTREFAQETKSDPDAL
ncbi:hypothetical protein LTR09_007455 [Extremus antarcticus]|uniref:Uncharacterized protein n=1 Tax=Extremus antarcticus TaxID=702011 RepID=A0AAJ0GB18_9PEZI|nr:hypothetical protein LTR09_007455 [Extremus antarcticus]